MLGLVTAAGPFKLVDAKLVHLLMINTLPKAELKRYRIEDTMEPAFVSLLSNGGLDGLLKKHSDRLARNIDKIGFSPKEAQRIRVLLIALV